MNGEYLRASRTIDEAEKPFWISYADLMTALMILFLVIMVTSLASISSKTQKVVEKAKVNSRQADEQNLRLAEIHSMCEQLAQKAARTQTGAQVDCKLNRINFGEVGRFRTDDYKLGPKGIEMLEGMVPVILETANTPLGKKWLKQVLIEGFTDTDGSYLYNLNLSLKRSEWVMCSLLRNDQDSPVKLTSEQRRQVKKIFLAGGVSFNDVRDSKDASRRVELRLQFHGLEDQKQASNEYEAKFQDGGIEKCMI